LRCLYDLLLSVKFPKMTTNIRSCEEAVLIIKVIIVVVLSALFCAGCVNQQNLCQVRDWQIDNVAKSCKSGQRVVFLPRSWGNEQLPILFVAGNCDHRYSIALTNGGVSCIYKPVVSVSEPPDAE
jgi:hypothetical protein